MTSAREPSAEALRLADCAADDICQEADPTVADHWTKAMTRALALRLDAEVSDATSAAYERAARAVEGYDSFRASQPGWNISVAGAIRALATEENA